MILVDNAVGHFANTCFKIDSFKVSRYVDALFSKFTTVFFFLLKQTCANIDVLHIPHLAKSNQIDKSTDHVKKMTKDQQTGH